MNVAELNHLRRLIAWMETEYCLNEFAQKGVIAGLNTAITHGIATQRKATAFLAEAAHSSMRCPLYVRQAVKALKKYEREHDKRMKILNAKRVEAS